MLSFRPPGLEFIILCLEGSVISIISPSSGCSPGPIQPICAQRWPKTPFISFHSEHHYEPIPLHTSPVCCDGAAALVAPLNACHVGVCVCPSTLAFRFQRNKMFPPCLLKNQYSGEPPRSRRDLISLEPPRFEFRNLCLEGMQCHSFIHSFILYINIHFIHDKYLDVF